MSQNSGNHYTTLKVKFVLNKADITNELYIDIGSDKTHPLYGIVSNLKKEAVTITEDGNQKVIQNEIDMLEYLKLKGWIIQHVVSVKILGADYLQYILVQNND